MSASQDDIVKLLIEHNADVNARTEVGIYTHDMHMRFIYIEEIVAFCVCVCVCVYE